MNEKDREIALFRLTVLGPLASRAQLSRGERKKYSMTWRQQPIKSHTLHDAISAQKQ